MYPATERHTRHHVTLLSCPVLTILVIDVVRLCQFAACFQCLHHHHDQRGQKRHRHIDYDHFPLPDYCHTMLPKDPARTLAP